MTTTLGKLGSGTFGEFGVKDLAPPKIETPDYEMKPDVARKKLREAAESKTQLERAQTERQAEAEREKAAGETTIAKEYAEKVKEDPYKLLEDQRIEERDRLKFVPNQENVQDLGTLFTLTNLLGFMIGGKSKGNAQAAMSAMNGMLEGHQKGREDLYKKEKDIYDQNMKALDRTIDTLAKRVQQNLTLYQTDRDAGMAALRTTIAEHNATFLKDTLEKYGPAYMYDKLKTIVDLADKKQAADLAAEKAAEARAHQQKMEGYEEKKLGFEAEKVGLERQKVAAQLRQEGDQYTENAAQAIANYAQAPPGLRDKNRYKILARVRELNPTYNEGMYKDMDTAYRNWTQPNGTGGKQILAFNTVASHLDSIEALAKALENRDQPGVNAAVNFIKNNTGDQKVTDFNTARQAVAAELVKAIEGSAGALGDREEALKTLDPTKSPAQLMGTIKIYKELIKRRIEASKYMYEQSTGRKNFEQFIPPEVRRSFGIDDVIAARPLPESPQSSVPTTTGPKEGDKNKSKSGRPIIFRGGEWHYEDER